ncbi:olfactory receptor 10A2 [Chelonia mydas]|uniref:olfactory receptor 10A2 n=1 Tax=Chelonia mydas TaxID=8469 RepID=UPI001CA8324A|nr:olfactory receptor 10A2 [Chelonia mydas]
MVIRSTFCFFVVFLVIYLLTLIENFLIILTTLVDPALHCPMYFFLQNLSFVHIFNLVTVPKMLMNLVSKNKDIYCSGDMTHTNFFFFGITESFLLSAMAYNRYVARCDPLHYTTIMNKKFFKKLAVTSWFSGIPVGSLQTTWLFSFPFCRSNELNHFFCDAPTILEFVYADSYLFEISLIASTILTFPPFLIILFSYVHIISTILKMPTAIGRPKIFSTCSSHLIVVTLFYGMASFTYLPPKSIYSTNTKKLLSLSYTVFTPMLNPIIYSLRNNEVKGTLKGILNKRNVF